MKPNTWSWVLALAILFSPSSAPAQCSGGMMGNGHEHGDRASTKEDRSTKGDRKTKESIAKLLDQERSRSILLEAVLADPEFMRALFGRVARVPEWRAVATEQLDAGSPAPASIDTKLQEPENPSHEDTAVYTCPMHPEVVSQAPGKCPKCGMTLERADQ